MKHFVFLLLQWLVAGNTWAQDSIIGKRWQLSGFADLYYQYDFNKPISRERPPFVYNHKKHNRPSVNLALLKLSYHDKKWNTNLALMAGDYARNNLAAEPRWLQHVFEATIGYRFTEKFSAEAGILPSHLGMETAISKDCWNLSRSLLAENSPYFETGMKLSYTFNPELAVSLLLLNGWQNIKENNRSKSIGSQIVYKPNGKWLINSSLFAGNERPDSVAAAIRLFHNFFVTYAVHPKLNAALLMDAGIEGKESWWGMAILLQYNLSKKWKTAARAERYNDPQSVIIKAYPASGIQVNGYSMNIDYLPQKLISIRSELKYIKADQPFFTRSGRMVSDGFSVLVSIATWF